jgi:hypothetical protein
MDGAVDAESSLTETEQDTDVERRAQTTEETPFVLKRMGHRQQVWHALTILADPHPGRWRARMQAARTLSHAEVATDLVDITADTLSAVLNDELPGDDRNEREAALRLRLLLGIPLGAVSAFWVGALLTGLEMPEPLTYILELFAGGLILMSVAGAPLWRALLLDLEDHRVRRLQRAIAHTLCCLHIPRSVGALVLVLRRHPRLRAQAETAFAAAVSGLTIDHYGTLPPKAIRHLCDLLVCGQHREAVELQCLLALEKIGNGHAIPSVEFMAAKGRTAQVRQAAAAILPVLEQRHRSETDPHMLLRGTTMPESDPRQLVRSTAGTERPEQMLRPAASQPDDAPELLMRSHPQS